MDRMDMATVYVVAHWAREFLDLHVKWCRSQPKTGLIRIDAYPVEGPSNGTERQFLHVPEEFLTRLREEQFPFRHDRPGS
jgi:hypothetical protein